MTLPTDPNATAEPSGDSGWMAGATISLSDLKAKRAAMTQGEWVSSPEDADDGEVYTDDPYKIIVRTGRAPVAANATGIVATHNAADVLIGLAEAALAYEQARKAFEESAVMDDRPVFEGHRWKMNARHRELLAVLAKVSP